MGILGSNDELMSTPITLSSSANNTLLSATGETRFATNFIMLESVVKAKRELQQTVVDPKWEAWVE